MIQINNIFSDAAGSSNMVLAAREISTSEINLFLVVSAALIILILVVTYFSMKVRKLTTELQEKQKALSDGGTDGKTTKFQSESFMEENRDAKLLSGEFFELLLKSLNQGLACFDNRTFV